MISSWIDVNWSVGASRNGDKCDAAGHEIGTESLTMSGDKSGSMYICEPLGEIVVSNARLEQDKLAGAGMAFLPHRHARDGPSD